MPISDAVLNKSSSRYIKVEETAPLTEAFTLLKKANGLGWWKLIVHRASGVWDVIEFSGLDSLAAMMGPDFFKLPIANLPIEFERPLVREQSSLSDSAAEQLARDSPGKVLIITTNGQFAGIIVAVRRGSDLFSGPSAVELFGALADLKEDPRAGYAAIAPPPTCPHCNQQSYRGYDVKTKSFYCLNCKKVV